MRNLTGLTGFLVTDKIKLRSIASAAKEIL
jgi:hypothetical protein